MRLYRDINEGRDASKATRMQEGLHCLFFSIAQKNPKKLSEKVIGDPEFMQAAYDTYCSVDTPFGELYAFAQKNPQWVKSVVSSAKALFKSGWLKGKYTFHRGDAYMNSIYDQWKRFKSLLKIKLGDDKWNPADVWAEKGSVPIPNFDSLDEYNSWIAKMLHSGKLIPISLKKTTGGSKVKLEGDPEDLKAHQKRKYEGVKRPRMIFPTGVSILVGGKETINIRSFALNKADGRITGEIVKTGAEARLGKVPADYFRKTIKDYNIPQMTLSQIKSLSDDDLINKLLEMWMILGQNFPEEEIEKQFKVRSVTGNKKQKWRDRDSYWQSVINSFQVASWLESAGSVADDIIDRWYQGAKSKTDFSSQFIKVY